MQKYDTWLDFFELRGLSYRLCSLDERHHCIECVRTSLLYYKKDIWPFSHSQQQSRIKGQTESHFAIYSRNSVPCEFNCLRLLLKWEGEKTMGVRHWDDTSRKMTVSAVSTIKMRWKGERARRKKRALNIKNDQFVELCVFQFMNSAESRDITCQRDFYPCPLCWRQAFVLSYLRGWIFLRLWLKL